jgi:hypothetical protein
VFTGFPQGPRGNEELLYRPTLENEASAASKWAAPAVTSLKEILWLGTCTQTAVYASLVARPLVTARIALRPFDSTRPRPTRFPFNLLDIYQTPAAVVCSVLLIFALYFTNLAIAS